MPACNSTEQFDGTSINYCERHCPSRKRDAAMPPPDDNHEVITPRDELPPGVLWIPVQGPEVRGLLEHLSLDRRAGPLVGEAATILGKCIPPQGARRTQPPASSLVRPERQNAFNGGCRISARQRLSDGDRHGDRDYLAISPAVVLRRIYGFRTTENGACFSTRGPISAAAPTLPTGTSTCQTIVVRPCS